MKRTSLVTYRSSVVTPDMAEALRQLEVRAVAVGGVKIIYKGVKAQEATWQGVQADPGPTGNPPAISLRPAGREGYLRLQFNDPNDGRDDLAVLWGLVVPLGFVPWLRYPLHGHGDDVFHFFGPWHGLYDSLCGEGRGELAWPSVCAASQVDVGTWEGSKITERFVQAQLHRLGAICGPVDGDIGDRTLMALRSVGIKGAVLSVAAERLMGMTTPVPKSEDRHRGYFVAPGRMLSVTSFGKIAAQRTPHGVALTIDGPGRLVIDVGQTETR